MSGNKKVTIGVVLLGTKYLKESLASLIDQDYSNIEYIFRDQEEAKHTAYDFIKRELPEVFQKATIIKGDNLWHSGGHNAIINQMAGDYYFCLSNDMLYPKDFVSKMVQALEQNPEYSFATCKIMRWDYEHNKKTEYIDSLGIGITPYHHFCDIGQGEMDSGQYDNLKEVFGVSGALFVLSQKALNSIKYQNERGENEYFDELLHYKNDVDLSYRLRWAGEKALLVHNTQVYHDRQASKDSKKTFFVKTSSFIGEKILMRKNFSNKYSASLRLQTFVYHWLKTIFLLLTVPKLFQEFKKLKALAPKINLRKSAVNRKLTPAQMEKIINEA